MSTIKDVAKLAGVSFKTVSRVINETESVSPVIQGKVRRAIDELGYVPNLSARDLRGQPTSIAFIYDNPNDHYIIQLQHGMLEECRNRDYEVVIHPCNSKSTDIATELLGVVRRAKIGGLLLAPPVSEMSEIVSLVQKADVPFVRIISGSSAPDDLSPCVFIDDRRAAYDITRHLIELGHERLAFLGGEPEHKSTGERFSGFLQAIEESGLRFDDKLSIEGQYSFESGVERMDLLFERRTRPTAVFACNDEIAAGAIFAAGMANVDVPAALSISGFEDSPFSRQSRAQYHDGPAG